jgi:integrase
MPLQKITRRQYQAELAALKQKYSPNTLVSIHSTARMIFSKAKEFDLIKSDPTEYAKLAQSPNNLEEVESEKIKYLEKEELKTFLQTALKFGNRNDYRIFLTLAYTGLRIGELLALKWTDINFEEKYINITKTLYHRTVASNYRLLRPKTKKSVRKIETSEKVLSELKKHRRLQNRDRLACANKWHASNLVFTSQKKPGYPINISFAGERMRKLLKIAGLSQSLAPHSLRHTHTSLLAEAGVGLEEIMQRLGHTNDKTTRQVYLHVTKSMKKEAVAKFDSLMDNL